MVSPGVECEPFLRPISRLVVDAGDSSFVPADVVQHRLDDVRVDADGLLGHAGRDGPADVVDSPFWNIELGVEFGLALRPSLKATSALAEDEIAVMAPRDAFEDVNHG